MNESHRKTNSVSRISAAFLCGILFVYHLICINAYSVNIPYWDEWETLRPDALDSKLNLHWLFAQHNEHRIVFTNLLTWVLYHLNGWNLTTNIFINLFIFGAIPFLIFNFSKHLKPETQKYAPWFVPFLFSMVAVENFTWGFQSQFHFLVLFFLGSVYFLFLRAPSFRNVAIAALLSTCAIFSFSAGIAICLAVLVVFYLSQFATGQFISLPKNLFFGTWVVTSIAVWFLIGYQAPENHPSFSVVFSVKFIDYFLNVVSNGFGILRTSMGLGFLYSAFAFAPVLLLFKNRKTRSRQDWALACVILGVAASLLSISIGRAAFGPAQAKSSRYAEIGMLLVPFSTMLWLELSSLSKTTLKRTVLISWIIIFAGFASHWNAKIYRKIFEPRVEGYTCAKKFYLGQGRDLCPGLVYPVSIDDRLLHAKDLNISFYREMIAEPRP